MLKKGKIGLITDGSEKGEACLQGAEVANVKDGAIYYEWTSKALEAVFRSLSEVTSAYLIENSCW